ncbi:MAG: ATP-binding protein, partial [Oscillospiraceae bacterium]|nr:ATP-binding protein [Oscillospiraceae bacterium]
MKSMRKFICKMFVSKLNMLTVSKRALLMLFIACFSIAALSACTSQQSQQSQQTQQSQQSQQSQQTQQTQQPRSVNPFTSFRDIPGLTEKEIADIDRLQNAHSSLSYGMIMSTEAFRTTNNEIGGYSALMCEWLTGLFDIEFKVEIYPMNELLEKLDSHEVDFSGVMMTNEAHLEKYIMTDIIAERQFVLFRIAGNPPLSQIAQERPLRYIFVENAPAERAAAAVTEPGTYEPVWVRNASEAYEVLKSGQADAFFASNNNYALYIEYEDIIMEDFFPLIFNPVSMATANPELESIISAVKKAQQNGADAYLNQLYNRAYQDYQKHKLTARLTEEEREFIRNNPVVPVIAISSNYPISFFNHRENEWQGVFFDLLREIEDLTDMSFEMVNDENTDWFVLLDKLKNKEALIIGELLWTKAREENFTWPETMILNDHYALISMENQHNVTINEIRHLTVGLARDTGYTAMFRQWFPDHEHTVEFDSIEETFVALRNGEVDLVMTTERRLMYLTHYQELTGYKLNYVFDQSIETRFGLHKDNTVLGSILDKALQSIDIKGISNQWMNRTFDYRLKVAEARVPLLIGVSVSFAFIVVLVLVMLLRNRKTTKQQAQTSAQNTLQLTKLNLMIKAAHIGLWDVEISRDDPVNPKNTFIWSDEFRKMLGYDTEAEFPNVLDSLKKVMHPDYEERTDKAFINHVLDTTGNTPFDVEYQLMKKNGEYSYFHACGEAIRDEDGNAIHIAGAIIDITQQKEHLAEIEETQEDMRIARDLAEEANRSKSIFLANMSHEIRTPMNSIVGFSELAHSDDNPEKTNQYLTNISDNAKWLLNIINDILDSAKIESGKIILEHIPFNLDDVVSQCQSAIMPKLIEKGLSLYCYSEPLPDKKLLGDPVRLRQVFMNLLSNAVKFTNTGTVKLLTSIVSSDDEQAVVNFEVKDSGIGMSPEQIKKIFEPFLQADDSVTRNFGGTGLGLSISKNIIEMMGGTLSVESTEGTGSRFSFDLTFNIVADTGTPVQKLILNDIERPTFSGEVLVCEDNILNQQVICEHLSRVGIKTAVAQNGQEAVDIITQRLQNNEKPFDLIFMDIHMPVMDGLEAASQISAMGVETPVIALTANIMSNDLEHYKRSNMLDYLGKPFTSQELWKCLIKYFTVIKVTAIDKEQQSADDEKALKQLKLYFVKNNQSTFENIKKAI